MKIVWRKFQWQRIGRFWLYYRHPATGEMRYGSISHYLTIRRQINYWQAWNKGFEAGVPTYKDKHD